MNKKNSYFENVAMPDDTFRIKSFVSSALSSNISVHPHWHSEIEVLYLLSGIATQQVTDRIFTVETGDIVIIGKNQLHSTYTYRGVRCEILVIMFDKSFLFNLFGQGGAPDIFENDMVFKNPLKADTPQGARLGDCLTGLHRELGGTLPGCRFAVMSRLYEAAALLMRGGAYQVVPGNSKSLVFSTNMLEKTFRLIDERYAEKISITAAASAASLSVSHFCRLFKKTTGMTFKTYLTFFRVNKAELMLLSGRTVTETALDCGFGSVSSFIRSFKEYKNCTPSSYKGARPNAPG